MLFLFFILKEYINNMQDAKLMYSIYQNHIFHSSQLFLTLQNIKLSHFLLKCLAFAMKPSLHSVHWYCYSSWLKSSWYQMIGRLVAWDPHPLVPRYKEVELGTRLHQKSKSNLYMRGILFCILLTLEMRGDK